MEICTVLNYANNVSILCIDDEALSDLKLRI